MYFSEAPRWAAEAIRLRPELRHRSLTPTGLIRIEADPTAWQGWKAVPAGPLEEVFDVELPRSWSYTFDFGEYCVGYIEIGFGFSRRIDAPFRFRIKLAETPFEMASDFDSYRGGLGRGWLQEESFVFDAPPPVIRLPRRYAFRYLRLTVESNSSYYAVSLKSLRCDAVSSADPDRLTSLPTGCDELDRSIDRIGSATLAACMQTCYEDGPKRDRRLWLGDLRLQALADYTRFRNFNLIRRCLLLFAAATDEEGRVPACVYSDEPMPAAGNFIFDYGVLFGDILLDHLRAGGDIGFIRDLWPVAKRQCELALEDFEDDLFLDRHRHWLFIDWQDGLEKECAIQGVVTYAFARTGELAAELGCEAEVLEYPVIAARMRAAAREKWFDERAGFFRSGASRQLSWASQIWMALAGTLTEAETIDLLRRTIAGTGLVKPGGPYLYNQMVLALERAGLHDDARRLTRDYWGKMAELGADTFWEVFLPEEPLRTPYGDPMVNSHCHAWSTPVYHFRA